MVQPLRVDPCFHPPLVEDEGNLSTVPACMEKARGRRLVLRLPSGDEVPLDRELTIGHALGSDVVLHDDRVSRRHCRIRIDDGRVRVLDLGSTNGTFLNGLCVKEAELTVGGVLSLGRTQLHIVVADDHPTIAGESPAMRELREHIARYAPIDLPVLITGETGTGKELVARALHEQSGRRGAFVPLNCGAISKDLVESELFGHERGAFTGATIRKPGVFQAADGGTLFLDEIGELPAALQPRLLRALESGRVRPVGASQEVAVKVRVVAATHVDLEAAMIRGEFRRDLFYRLDGAKLKTPPLRAHAEDIPRLVNTILDGESANFGACAVSDEAMALLSAHPWPGNVRELRNVLRRAAALRKPLIEADDIELPPGVVPRGDQLVRIDGRSFGEIEREVLGRTLERHHGNQRATAIALDMPRSTLSDKVKRYKLVAK